MKEETTLLLEKEVDIKTEKKIKEIVTKKKEKKLLKNLFSSKTTIEEVVEKPNYDTIKELDPEKRKKIFKLEKEKENKKYKINKKLKVALLAISLCLLTAFCITTTIEITKASSSIEQIENGYNASLSKLIQKINSTETGNRSLDLFETFPEEDLTASSIYQSSNWFDRFCNFLTRFFGG